MYLRRDSWQVIYFFLYIIVQKNYWFTNWSAIINFFKSISPYSFPFTSHTFVKFIILNCILRRRLEFVRLLYVKKLQLDNNEIKLIIFQANHSFLRYTNKQFKKKKDTILNRKRMKLLIIYLYKYKLYKYIYILYYNYIIKYIYNYIF